MDLLPDYAGALTPDITVATDNNVDEQGFVMRVEKTGITVLYRDVWTKKNKLTGWVGFWWFVDRQVAKLYYHQTGDVKYTYLIHDHKEYGV